MDRCVLINARSISGKLPDLLFLIDNHHPKIIAVTETWLSDYITDSFIVGKYDYAIIRRDRPGQRQGGGLMFLVHSSIQYVRIESEGFDNDSEILCVDLLCSSNIYRFILCYRPPVYDFDRLKCLISSIKSVIIDSRVCILLGDFNLPEIDWNQPFGNYNRLCTEFLDLIFSLSFAQYVLEPTRNNNVLDLVFCSLPNIIQSCHVGELFSDHCIVFFDLSLYSCSPTTISSYIDFNSGNYDNFCSYIMSFDWSVFFISFNSVISAYNVFIDAVHYAISLFFPTKFKKSIGQRHRWPKSIKNIEGKKLNAWQQYKLLPTCDAARETYLDLKRRCSRAKLDYVHEQECRVLHSNNIKHFYNFVNGKLRNKPVIPALSNNSDSISADNDKATCFNDYFKTVFTSDADIVCLPDFPNRCAENISMSPLVFTPELVRKALLGLSNSNSSGSDLLTCKFLKKCAFVFDIPLSILFNTSLSLHALPEQWLCADVIPVFKKGNSSVVSNYRPISLTSNVCKTMESIIKSHILHYLLKHKFISSAQHGFLSKHSTESQLHEFLHKWFLFNDRNIPVDCIYLDFAKAFDTVSHKLLLFKLSRYGFDPYILQWIRAYLANRKQRVRINGSFSEYCDVTSGVPQGSVLGPLLFLLFINDLPDCIAFCPVKLYADDAKLCSAITSTNDIDNLSSDLKSVVTWSDTWNLKLSLKKCSCLHIGSQNCNNIYSVQASDLLNVDSVRDLGVIMSHNLCFTPHCTLIFRKSMQIVNLIFKAFSCKKIDFYKRMFVTYIRPHLEYCCTVWSPSKVSDIDMVERVQRNFTSRIPGLRNFCYVERLEILDLQLLEFRRILFDLFFLFKILHNIVVCDVREFIVFSDGITRGNGRLILLPSFKKECTRRSYIIRVIRYWNALPSDIQLLTSYTCFKQAVASFSNLSQFLNGSFISH